MSYATPIEPCRDRLARERGGGEGPAAAWASRMRGERRKRSRSLPRGWSGGAARTPCFLVRPAVELLKTQQGWVITTQVASNFGRLLAMDEFNLDRPESDLPSPDLRARRWSAWFLRWRVPIITIAVAVALLALIVISPIFFNQITLAKGINWIRLGNIGQAYGGASAILAGVALVGISGSLLIQVRQARTERVRLVREQQFELLRLALDNLRVYAPVLGTRTGSTADEVRQFLFATMSMVNALLGYETGIFTKQDLTEEILPSMFATEPGRKWWEVAQKYWTPRANMTRRERQFMQIANDEYRRVIVSGRPPVKRVINDPLSNMPKTSSASKWGIPLVRLLVQV